MSGADESAAKAGAVTDPAGAGAFDGWDLGERPFLEVPGPGSPLLQQLLRASDISSLRLALDATNSWSGGSGLLGADAEDIVLAASPAFATFADNFHHHIGRSARYAEDAGAFRPYGLIQTMEFFHIYRSEAQIEKCFLQHFATMCDVGRTDPFAFLNFAALAALSYARRSRPDFALVILDDCISRHAEGPLDELRIVENIALAIGNHACSTETLHRRAAQLNALGADVRCTWAGPARCDAKALAARFRCNETVRAPAGPLRDPTIGHGQRLRISLVRWAETTPWLRQRLASLGRRSPRIKAALMAVYNRLHD